MAERRRKFDREFKMETARLIVEGGRKVSEIAQDFDIHENVLRKWKNQYIEDKEYSFPGKGRLKPDEEELRRLKRENADLREERDILPWPSSQNTRNEISVYVYLPFPIQGEEDVPDIPSIQERILRVEKTAHESKTEG